MFRPARLGGKTMGPFDAIDRALVKGRKPPAGFGRSRPALIPFRSRNDWTPEK